MRLTDLLRASGYTPSAKAASKNPEIRGITADSRKVGPGYLFAALPGARLDGRAYLGEAAAKGAAAVLVPRDTDLKAFPLGERGADVVLLLDDNPRRRLALLAAGFFGRQPEKVAAVTGTNGKTSVANFARQLWQALGHEAASLGTLGATPSLPDAPKSLTTPDPVNLHKYLADVAEMGIGHLAMEASSHGLAQYRLDGVKVAAAAFTNLTRDHLDYHGTMEAYRAAKLRLFSDLVVAGGAAVLNADAPDYPYFEEAAAARGLTIYSYGRAGTELRLIEQTPTADGQEIVLEVLGKRHKAKLALFGAFQAANVLAALGLVIATGSDPQKAAKALVKLSGVPGRMELVATTPKGGQVYVDYAHTPDALETALVAVRPHVAGRLWVVFGCGGDRDKGKRPLMGAACAKFADRVVVTDDNPRSEDPATIRRAALEGAPGAQEIGDRGAAIATAMAALGPGDALVVAGKGHETGQIVGDRILPFDDAAVARAAAKALAGERS